MKMISKMIACCLLFFVSFVARAQETIDSVSAQGGKSNLMTRLHQVQQFLDNKAKKKVDPSYIEVPEKPWRVVLRYNASVFDVDYSNSISDPATGDGLDWEMCFEPPMASSIGVWAGYRGTGIGFSRSLHRKKGVTLSFTTTGAKYGATIRLRGFDIDEVTVNSTVHEGGQEVKDEMKGDLNVPASVASLYLNGYYVFNGRRYSQAAAYNQSVIQRRSAGSFLLGATWYMSAFDFSDDKNSGIGMILLSNNIGRVKLHQGNIGVGYGYNWVPLRGLVINAMVMPTISFYNRVKVYKYDCNYELVEAKGPTDDYGQWNPETHTWANGKTHRPIDVNDPAWLDNADSWRAGSESEYSMFKFNVDLRLGIAYNWSDYFIGIQAQFKNFNYKKDPCKVNLYDAYGRVAFGVRL